MRIERECVDHRLLRDVAEMNIVRGLPGFVFAFFLRFVADDDAAAAAAAAAEAATCTAFFAATISPSFIAGAVETLAAADADASASGLASSLGHL